MVSKLALGAIWGYQQYISPRKGFRCAHSVLHGGTGCSGFAKHAIRDHGMWGALPEIRRRFRACREASLTLRQTCAVHATRHDGDGEHDEDDPRARKRRNRERWQDAACNCGGSACALPTFCAASSTGAQTDAPPPADGGGGCVPDSIPDCTPDCGGCTPDCSCAPSCS